MGRRLKKTGICLPALLLAGLLTGCSLETSVENLFVLPQIPVEYTGLQQELSDLQAAGYEYMAPTGGSNLQSLQMVDLNGDGQEEAVAFLRRSTDEQPLKIMIFQTDGESFAPACTIASGGTSVESVSYRDYNGDGSLELTVGWRIGTDVQTVAVYALGSAEATALMQSSYIRFAVDDLDGNELSDLLVARADDSGSALAEHYCWQDGALRVCGSCRLSSTPVELQQGEILCGKLDSQTAAAFLTGISDTNTAMTDILLCGESGITNVSMDTSTARTKLQYAYSQLRPQDMNGDGVIEIPYLISGGRAAAGLFSWYRYDSHGNSLWVADTYHDSGNNWYLTMSEDWHGRLEGTGAAAITGGSAVTVCIDGEAALLLDIFTGENREQDAAADGRTVLARRTGSIYAAEITEAGEECGISLDWVRSHFHLISAAWTAQ